MDKIILREFRKMPFCWQDKTVLRKINNETNRKEIWAIRNTYFTLTEIASNQENEKISTFLFDIAKISWLSEKTISKCLEHLEKLWIVFVQPQERWTDGRYKNKEIWLIWNNTTVGKLEKSSKKVWRKIKKSLVCESSDNIEIILEDNIEDSVEGSEEKKDPPHTHKNIDYINWMRNVEIKWNHRIKNWNEKTWKWDLMNSEIKKSMYDIMKNVTADEFQKRVDNYVMTLLLIDKFKLRSYLFFQIWDFDIVMFLTHINKFYWEIPTILSKLAKNEYKTKIVNMIKEPSKQEVQEIKTEPSKMTDEQKKELVSQLRSKMEKINKL